MLLRLVAGAVKRGLAALRSAAQAHGIFWHAGYDKASVAEVNARLAEYGRELKDFYDLRFIQEKNSGLPGVLRHEAIELLVA